MTTLYIRIDEPKTWTDVPGERFVHYDPARPSDIQKALAEHGLAMVPLEPTEERIAAGIRENQESCGYDLGRAAMTALYKAMTAKAPK
jgi:hypothetical protein